MTSRQAATSWGTKASGATVHTECPPATRRTTAPTIASASDSWRSIGTTSSPSVAITTAGMGTSPIQSRESKRPISRPASTIRGQSWRATSSKPHHGRPRRLCQRHHAVQAAPVIERSGTTPATAEVPDAAPNTSRSRRLEEKWVLVADSTSPDTSSGWRFQSSWAIGPPIE